MGIRDDRGVQENKEGRDTQEAHVARRSWQGMKVEMRREDERAQVNREGHHKQEGGVLTKKDEWEG